MRSAINARIMPGFACRNVSAPVSAASAHPRSGSGVSRRYPVINRSLLLRPGSYARRSSMLAKRFTALAPPRHSSVGLLVVAIADDGEWARPQPALRAPVHERVLLAMGDPDLGCTGCQHRGVETIPVGMVGYDERQLDQMLPGARAHAHPARCQAGDGIGETPRPRLLQGRWRANRNRAREGGLACSAHQLDAAEVDATLLIVARDLLHRPMQDRWAGRSRPRRSNAMMRCALPSE